MSNNYEILDPGFLADDLDVASGDLAPNDHYDYAQLLDVDNVNAALLRRVNTEQGEIAVVIEDVEGLKVIRENVGNPAFALLSEPLTPATISAMADGIGQCVLQDDRLELLETTRRLSVSDEGELMPIYDVLYMIRGNSTRAVVSIAQNQLSGKFELL